MPYCPRREDRRVQSFDSWTSLDWCEHTEQPSMLRYWFHMPKQSVVARSSGIPWFLETSAL
eukprot:7906842-Lingulodinium_polyedra.AAC.1